MIATAFLLLLGLLALSVPVGAVLGVMGLALGEIYAQLPLWLAAGQVSWNANSSFTLFALPLFVLLGQILLRAGIAERMYTALAHWMSWIPGGLMHSNIAACTLFSATCGSSSATAATVGSVAMSQAGKYRYNEGLFCGSIASGGTLGILIPPSINLILYGVPDGHLHPQALSGRHAARPRSVRTVHGGYPGLSACSARDGEVCASRPRGRSESRRCPISCPRSSSSSS